MTGSSICCGHRGPRTGKPWRGWPAPGGRLQTGSGRRWKAQTRKKPNGEARPAFVHYPGFRGPLPPFRRTASPARSAAPPARAGRSGPARSCRPVRPRPVVPAAQAPPGSAAGQAPPGSAGRWPAIPGCRPAADTTLLVRAHHSRLRPASSTSPPKLRRAGSGQVQQAFGHALPGKRRNEQEQAFQHRHQADGGEQIFHGGTPEKHTGPGGWPGPVG